jgi:sec-independent protein translocase protein TatA
VFDISPIQIIIVLAIALLIFGPKRLPDLGRNLGKGIRDFKEGIVGDETSAIVPTPAVSNEPIAVNEPVVEPTAADLIVESATPDAVETVVETRPTANV